MKIATWNINGVKARLDTALTWLQSAKPDVVCFQEIKSVDANFPKEPFEELGYTVATHGQKSFNGVAILSRRGIDDLRPRLPGDNDDEQARYLEADIAGDDGIITVASIYLPNGNPIGTEKFSYKLAWMQRLETRVRERLSLEMPLVLAGDYNVIPEPLDAKTPKAWVEDALYQPESRSAFRALSALGFTDAVRTCYPNDGVYTFWDYQAGAWNKNNGIRIDHMMLSPQAADRLTASGIDRETRGWEKPSDHVPVWIELSI
ncbi:MAG: exodeoxyribonuclease III [Hyphomicrobiaceae bacterium]|nr:exodeoxyribonuclease III [Hyphomicrobiaceae bacterium]MCC0010592.1 exodeoxyribonuclease III [Hyphomicrobiaceae bacterium]